MRRVAEKSKRNSSPGRSRDSTRLACLYRKMTHSCLLRAVPLQIRALARDLGMSYENVLRITSSFAQDESQGRHFKQWKSNPCPRIKSRLAWAFQHYGFIVFLRYKRHPVKKCGVPQFYVIGRQAIHRISWEGGTRARLRQKTPLLWRQYIAILEKLAWGHFLRRRERADDTHKGFPSRETGGSRLARPPPTANRPGLRRFSRVALDLQREYDRLGATKTDLHGWLLNRLSEWHSSERILACLKHARAVMPKGSFAPANEHAWLCAVAERHLDADGLARIQRRRDVQGRERHGAAAPTFKVNNARPNFIDADGNEWQHFGGTDWRKTE